MSRATELTTTDGLWSAAVATGECVITILDPGNGTLYINETAVDANANRFGSDLKANDQITQNSAVSTFIKSTGTKAWTLLIDGVI